MYNNLKLFFEAPNVENAQQILDEEEAHQYITQEKTLNVEQLSADIILGLLQLDMPIEEISFLTGVEMEELQKMQNAQ